MILGAVCGRDRRRGRGGVVVGAGSVRRPVRASGVASVGLAWMVTTGWAGELPARMPELEDDPPQSVPVRHGGAAHWPATISSSRFSSSFSDSAATT